MENMASNSESTKTAARSSPKHATSSTGIKRNPHPQVITVDTDNVKESEDNPSSTNGSTSASQARTPKHANKTKDSDDGETNAKASEPGSKEEKSGGLPPRPSTAGATLPDGGGYLPRTSFEGRPMGGNGAFQPHEPRRHHQGHPDQFYAQSPMQISPNGIYDRHNVPPVYYDRRGGPPPSAGSYGPPPPPPPGYYDQRGYDYGPPPPMVRAPPGGGYEAGLAYHRGQHPYPPQSFGGYQIDPRTGAPYGAGPPQPFGPGYHPGMGPGHEQFPREAGYPGSMDRPGGHNSTFSRAVSSSFDRSVKEKPTGAKVPVVPPSSRHDKPPSLGEEKDPAGDSSMASDDISWKQLKQVHSIDDSAIQAHLGLKKKTPIKDDDDSRNPPSNSSSLTNSPTDGVERRTKATEAVVAAAASVAASSAKQQSSSLDELSSVASAQAPMATKSKVDVPASPGTHDSASLDLMKCSSGSSGLLHLAPHQRNDGLLLDGKRGRDEERGDSNTGAATSGEIRRAPSDLDVKKPLKKARIESKQGVVKLAKADMNDKNKASPLSITCSPSADKAKTTTDPRKAPGSKGDNSFYDKPPAYSYSMDSAPPIPKDTGRLKSHLGPHASLPPRPGSSSSSTLTPGHMQIDSQDPANAVVSSIPSWEIHGQDSFGAGSVGGGQGLSNNFSFQDYPMLSASESNLGTMVGEGGLGLHGIPPAGQNPPGAPGLLHPGHPGHPPLESRNQSFEGGHYHGGGSFHRSDSMDISYASRPGPIYQDPYKHGHTGPFPPHAPSWGTAGSGGSHPSYQQGGPPGHIPFQGGRMGDYPIMRNYSQESAHRASPPPGPGGPVPGRHWGPPPSNFEPPPEFAAPHNHLNRRPPPAVYIMSSQGSHPNAKRGSGVFSWSKDDDIRLTEIMKKYKNPRDWEPISKEHGMGKTAKECHERWIRYLKPGVRKGQWTDQEDAIVIEAVTTSSEQPFTRWSDLAQRLPGRVGKQIRDRWVNHLNPNINHLPFSREDDLLLWDGHKKLGKRWVEISTKFFNCARSENHIKNRWYSASFKKFIANEFGPEAYSGGKSTKGKDTPKGKKMKKDDDDPALCTVDV
jgi:hypothetical protein